PWCASTGEQPRAATRFAAERSREGDDRSRLDGRSWSNFGTVWRCCEIRNPIIDAAIENQGARHRQETLPESLVVHYVSHEIDRRDCAETGDKSPERRQNPQF